MKINPHPYQYGIFYDQTARRAEITANRMGREVLWQWDENRQDIFITCPGCSAISTVQSPIVQPTHVVANCVVCSHCRTHFYVKLEGWDGPIDAVCGKCGRRGGISLENPLPEGWFRGKSDCSCSVCRGWVFCPNCKSRP